MILWSLVYGLVAAFPDGVHRIEKNKHKVGGPKHPHPKHEDPNNHPKSKQQQTNNQPTVSYESDPTPLNRIHSILQTTLEQVIGLSPQNPTFVPIPLQGDAFWNRSGTHHALPTSRVRRRCSDFWTCEHATMALEIDGAIFHNGILYLHNADTHSREAIKGVRKFYDSLKGRHPAAETPNLYYLPPTYTIYEGIPRWIEGLPIKFIETNNELNITTCQHLWDTSGYFLHPYYVDNNFHALNDNVFSVLASVVLQHIMGAAMEGSSHRTLFLFRNRDKAEKVHNASPMYKMLYMLFDDVKPAKDVVMGGPHCIRHMVGIPNLYLSCSSAIMSHILHPHPNLT